MWTQVLIKYCLFQALLQDIDNYRLTLDGVSKRGQYLTEQNPRVPRLAQQVQGQIQNLEESYLNLQATAQQIRVRILFYSYGLFQNSILQDLK